MMYVVKRRKLVILNSVFTVFLLVVALLAIGVGPMSATPMEVISILLEKIGFSLAQFTAAQESVILNIRLPRILAAVLVGASLSSSGAALQGLFRNPLVDPGLIGISSGAALAVASMIVFGRPLIDMLPEAMGLYVLAGIGFLGGMLATLIVIKIANFSGRILVSNLLLSGIAIQAVTFAGIGLLQFLGDDQQLRMITFWMLGSLGGAMWSSTGVLGILVMISTIYIIRDSKQLNLLALGEREASHLGLDIERLKKRIIFFVTLSVGASVSVSGSIGFIGLVVPHLVRLMFGADHRFLIPISVFVGAILLLLSDMMARTVVAPAELPIGVITSLIGGPFFIMLILRNKKIF